jgi:hypothetical protein
MQLEFETTLHKKRLLRGKEINLPDDGLIR